MKRLSTSARAALLAAAGQERACVGPDDRGSTCRHPRAQQPTGPDTDRSAACGRELGAGRVGFFMADHPCGRRLTDNADWARLISPPARRHGLGEVVAHGGS